MRLDPPADFEQLVLLAVLRLGDGAYAVPIRKGIEEGFGWTKEVAGLAQVKLRGLARVDFAFVLGLAAYNLVRLPKLLPEASP